MMGLLEPWLGRAASLADLPLPQLIDVTLTPGGDVQVKALAKRLDAAVPMPTSMIIAFGWPNFYGLSVRFKLLPYRC